MYSRLDSQVQSDLIFDMSSFPITTVTVLSIYFIHVNKSEYTENFQESFQETKNDQKNWKSNQ